jgi:hypothetical protein
MLVHIDKDNLEPIEQKIKNLIFRKLFVKVNEERIFINKEDFISLIFKDVVAIAKAEYDIEKALQIALNEQNEYQSIPEVKRNELLEAVEEFAVEIDAYAYYLNSMNEEIDHLQIYDEVLSIINAEIELLLNRLHELMMKVFEYKVSEEDAFMLGTNKRSLIDVFANQVKLIASNDTIEEAVEEAYSEFDNYPDRRNVKKESIKKEFERFAPLAQEEIATYRFALSMYKQNAEIPAILTTAKQILFKQ